MRELPWRTVAAILSHPRIAAWLIKRAQRTPYFPITSRDGAETYMDRWWVFNPYSTEGPPRWRWLPSIRVHHILRADDDGAMHDHPWNARTILLRGEYVEERPVPAVPKGVAWFPVFTVDGELRAGFVRARGYTGRVLFGQYHRISEVSPGGVYTLWFTWKYRGTWGFLVNGRKVPYREHLGQ